MGGGLLGAFGSVMLPRYWVKEAAVSINMQNFITGFQMGVLTAVLGALIFFFIKNWLAMRSPERLNKLYISETDERKRFIKQKSGSVGMNIVIYGLAVGTVVAGNINDIVFFTLLSACLFVALTRGSLKLYYRHKY